MNIILLQDIFSFSSEGGGSNVVVSGLAANFSKSGNKVSVICSTQDREKEGEENFESIDIHRIYADYHPRWKSYLGLYNPQTVKKVKRIIEDIKPDVVNAHNIHNQLSYHCLKIAKKSGAKVFLTSHDVQLFNHGKFMGKFIIKNENEHRPRYKTRSIDQLMNFRKRYNPLRNYVIRYYLSYVDKIVAVSSELKEALHQNGIKNTMVIHNAIDVSQWKVSGNDTRRFNKTYGLEQKKVILFGGRLSVAKGGLVILQAINSIQKKVPDVRLVIMGKKEKFMRNKKICEYVNKLRKNIIF
ncbi:MAG: glycosyltransferase family 4 protein, partial [Candidatus Pacebacteria bacterium]|nr:glycosyltransferase family 4 protein [Candidatus Paceibacterota bacterium]